MSTNIQQHLTAISRYELPQLFRDAIDVARALGCDYLWIDSLCIIQDSQEDWKDQSVLMSEVYSNAYLNIAASALPNSSGTLFQDRVCYFGRKVYSPDKRSTLPIDTHTEWVSNDKGVQCPVAVRYSMDRAHRHLCGEAEDKHGIEEPLLDRAWVFQERMLSRRAIYISSSEVLWECRSRYFCECGGINNPIPSDFGRFIWEFGHLGPLWIYNVPYHSPSSKTGSFADFCSSKRGSSKEALAFWRTMIQEYTSLILTRESDRDVALSGIRQSFSTGRDFTYYAGMWIQDLPQSLLWTIDNGASPIEAEEGMDAPSWSWLWRKDKDGLEILSNRVAWDHYDLEGFEKDSRVSFHVPDDAYRRFHNQPLIPPTLGHFPLHLTAPFLHGSLEPPTWDNMALPSMSFGPVTDRIKGYGEKLMMIQVWVDDLDYRGNWDMPGRRAYCVLLGHAPRPMRNNFHKTHECMLLLEEIPGPEHERRYVKTGLVNFTYSPLPEQNGEEDGFIQRTGLFEDARVKEFIIV
ncbi:heterokaryon incompatibility protein-domain-containing protein [Neurospora tetraspora]|uniref:Heterokaryon incompatibility protein-domain-containing protein n=1 Tax=Neurospora tetraspora TaxID=94610 RepID=A0AAE0MT00_9PEZI|nr:heterokaryon incompatibility protein-domain-containing protein [Neurospora tetraspora]